eukprot:SAG22_NODE_1242_length_5026_cov_2.748731_2_plen_71_part_00
MYTPVHAYVCRRSGAAAARARRRQCLSASARLRAAGHWHAVHPVAVAAAVMELAPRSSDDIVSAMAELVS